MAAIDDLIAQVDDPALRKRLREEVERLTREKKFGLVFEEHLPEVTPLYDAPVNPGSLVAQREAPLTQTWRVVSVEEGTAVGYDPETHVQRRSALADLVVVRRFGEPIFPALTAVDHVQNTDPAGLWHTLIEADNYHALQLLEYLYAGQVDCIYIDPPYNTGARDWKYNNDYVDGNDRWRHSKWLAMMKRRLVLARKLLNPFSGVLITTIDEHEVHHLGMLLDSVFPDAYRQIVTIVITTKGVAKQGLARVEEYAHFTYLDEASASATEDDFLTGADRRTQRTPWASLLRRGTNAAPSDRPGLVYPIQVNPQKMTIEGVGATLAERVDSGEISVSELNAFNPERDQSVAWPIRSDGSLGTWQVKPASLMQLNSDGFVKLGRFDDQRTSWAVNYLKRGPIQEIEGGTLLIKGYEWEGGPAILEYSDDSQGGRKAKTVWNRIAHDAGTYGSNLLRSVLGDRRFEFPKSLYAVRDTLSVVVSEKPNALILDFFAGSGTTLHAVNLLNAMDGGQRRCILVTNNEVSEEEARRLQQAGYAPGDPDWEAVGICRAVTFPRSKYTILGRRDDGTKLEGEYLTGKTAAREKPRTFRRLGFIDAATLTTAARKKEIAGLIEGIPMSHIKKDTAFFVSADHPATLLFDENQAPAFLEALGDLEDTAGITHVYLITSTAKLFDDLKTRITDLLGPLEVQEEEKRPMREGFPANLEYFKLDFLEKDQVALGQQFRAILPILWMRAGAIGPRPTLPEGNDLPAVLVPPDNPFAVLLDETRFAEFSSLVEAHPDLSHIFLVTDSEEAFHEMAVQLPEVQVIQLYRDYLENFTLNRGGGA